jgi:hypothetical protein
MVDISKTFGALLIGGLVAVALTGVVTLQTYVYFKLYPADLPRVKLLVLAIWTLDLFHTGFICAAIWGYLITNYGDAQIINHIPWTVALTILCTAILTLLVHCFFAHRIFTFSRRNWWNTAPILVLAVCRVSFACVTTSEMIRLGTFTRFKEQFRWVFTLGLAFSSTVDLVITVSLCYYLRSSRSSSLSMNDVIDRLILYTFENGSITCAATIISMICWLASPGNLIFMGIHFVIGKLYANSLLATLNTRQTLRRGRSQASTSGDAVPVVFFGGRAGHSRHPSSRDDTNGKGSLQINVNKTVEYEMSEDPDILPTKEESMLHR